MASWPRPARIEDVHELALGMPHVTRTAGPRGNLVYQVGGKSFVFFRTPRPPARAAAWLREHGRSSAVHSGRSGWRRTAPSRTWPRPPLRRCRAFPGWSGPARRRPPRPRRHLRRARDRHSGPASGGPADREPAGRARGEGPAGSRRRSPCPRWPGRPGSWCTGWCRPAGLRRAMRPAPPHYPARRRARAPAASPGQSRPRPGASPTAIRLFA